MPSAETLATFDTAFAGTVTSLEDGTATLAVDQWYAGGDADTVTVTTPGKDLAALLMAVEFEKGKSYLVSATDGRVTLCGFTAETSPGPPGPLRRGLRRLTRSALRQPQQALPGRTEGDQVGLVARGAVALERRADHAQVDGAHHVGEAVRGLQERTLAQHDRARVLVGVGAVAQLVHQLDGPPAARLG